MPLSLIIDNFRQNRLPEPWHFFGQTRPELNIQLATAVGGSLSTFRRLSDESKKKFYAFRFLQFLNELKTRVFLMRSTPSQTRSQMCSRVVMVRPAVALHSTTCLSFHIETFSMAASKQMGNIAFEILSAH